MPSQISMAPAICPGTQRGAMHWVLLFRPPEKDGVMRGAILGLDLASPALRLRGLRRRDGLPLQHLSAAYRHILNFGQLRLSARLSRRDPPGGTSEVPAR